MGGLAKRAESERGADTVPPGVVRNKVINRRTAAVAVAEQQDAVFDVVSRLIYELTRAACLSLRVCASVCVYVRVCLITQLRTTSIRHVARCTMPQHLWGQVLAALCAFHSPSAFQLSFALFSFSAKRFINVTSINKQAAVEKCRERDAAGGSIEQGKISCLTGNMCSL